jgi:hypothetical protein
MPADPIAGLFASVAIVCPPPPAYDEPLRGTRERWQLSCSFASSMAVVHVLPSPLSRLAEADPRRHEVMPSP